VRASRIRGARFECDTSTSNCFEYRDCVMLNEFCSLDFTYVDSEFENFVEIQAFRIEAFVVMDYRCSVSNIMCP
jgi:hypothetical protein